MAERFSTGLRNEVGKSGGSSYADALLNGVIYLFAGTQPSDADQDESSYTLICIISDGGATFTPGSPTAGINLDVASGGIVYKSTSETWKGTNLVAGKIGWGRFYANDRTQGASTTSVRFDFAVSQSGAELTLGSTDAEAGGETTISEFEVRLPGA